MRWRCRTWQSARRWADWPRPQRQSGLTGLWGRSVLQGHQGQEAHQPGLWGQSDQRNPWDLQGQSDQRGLRDRANPWGLPIQSDQLGQSVL